MRVLAAFEFSVPTCSQSSVTSVPEDLTPSSGLHRQNTRTCKVKLKKIKPKLMSSDSEAPVSTIGPGALVLVCTGDSVPSRSGNSRITKVLFSLEVGYYFA